MDKSEYNQKLQEIDQLVDQGNYEQAAALADQIDWKRVRNVRTLCLISEIYEAQDRYEDSKALLVRAYRRSPVGRAILYRLVEVTIKLKQFDEAIDYYSAYVQAAPNDTSKYILKYKIYRGRGSSVDEQIQILKEYLDQEYNEKYAYELARLYQEADRIQECLATCDDLVLWFHSGKYVIKALELKQRYAALTPKQQEIYNHRFDQEEEELFTREKEMVETDETSLAQEIMDDASREIADTVAAVQAEEDAEGEAGTEAEPEPDLPGEEPTISYGEMREVEPETGSEGAGQTEEAVYDAEPVKTAEGAAYDADVIPADVQEDTPEPDIEQREERKIDLSETQIMPEIRRSAVPVGDETAPEPEIPAEDALDDPVHDPGAFDEQLNKYNTRELQTEMIKSMREVIAGVGIRNLVDENEEAVDRVIEQSKEAQDESARETELNMTRTLAKPRLQKKRDAGQLSIDDILLSMGDSGSAVREAALKSSASNKETPAGVLSAVDEALLNMGIDPQPKPYTEKPLDELFKQDVSDTSETGEDAADLQEEIAQPLDTQPAGEQQFSQAAEEAVEQVEEAAEELFTEPAEKQAAEPAPEFAGNMQHEEGAAAVSYAAAQEAAEDKAEAAAEALTEEEAAAAADIDAAAADIAEDITAEFAAETPDDDVKIAAPVEHKQPEEVEKALETYDASQEEAQADEPESIAEDLREGTEQAASEETGEEASSSSSDTRQDKTMDEIINARTRVMPAEEISEKALAGSEPQQADPRQPKRYLKNELRGLFEGYLEIPDLEKQIAGAISQALAKGVDRTSRSGNVLIFGGHGCGKTTIATGLAKAIAQEKGLPTVKMAKIYATDLNRKDIAATIAKIAGGVLIVEEAGDLEDGIADQLTTAMEFRTDGLILILEDEQRYMHDLLMRHPRMTMKFTSQIYIPPFTIANLVRFGEIYADDRDYALSEGAASMLGSKLATVAEGEALSITQALDLVDKAIVRANKFGRKLFSGKKRFDEEGRVVLLEKDFR